MGVVNNVTGQGQAYQYGAPGNFNGRDNKLLTVSKMQQSVTNLLKNPSFLRSHTGDYQVHHNSAVNNTITWDTTRGHIDKSSVKLSKQGTEGSNLWLGQDKTGLAPGFYTLSAYVNTNGQRIDNGLSVYMETFNSDRQQVKNNRSEVIYYTEPNEWKRICVTVYVDSGVTPAAADWLYAQHAEGGGLGRRYTAGKDRRTPTASIWWKIRISPTG